MIFLEGFLRYIPGVVGKEESVLHDSFSGPFVDHPEYTEPVVWHGKAGARNYTLRKSCCN